MSDDWVNDPYDEAPVHVLDDDGEPDDVPADPEDQTAHLDGDTDGVEASEDGAPAR